MISEYLHFRISEFPKLRIAEFWNFRMSEFPTQNPKTRADTQTARHNPNLTCKVHAQAQSHNPSAKLPSRALNYLTQNQAVAAASAQSPTQVETRTGGQGTTPCCKHTVKDTKKTNATQA